MEFVARVLVQMSDPRRHLVRCYGAYSDASRGKRKKAAARANPPVRTRHAKMQRYRTNSGGSHRPPASRPREHGEEQDRVPRWADTLGESGLPRHKLLPDMGGLSGAVTPQRRSVAGLKSNLPFPSW